MTILWFAAASPTLKKSRNFSDNYSKELSFFLETEYLRKNADGKCLKNDSFAEKAKE